MMINKLEALGLRLTGEFTLHSGVKSNIFWDVERLFLHPQWMRLEAIRPFIWKIGLLRPTCLVGVPTGGRLLAKDIAACLEIPYFDDLLARFDNSKIILVDDVLTTGNTIRKYCKQSKQIIAVAILVNRSKPGQFVAINSIPLISGIFADRI
jgi:orotate phosphoribosyltransferase